MSNGVNSLGSLTVADFHALLPPPRHPAITNARRVLELEEQARHEQTWKHLTDAEWRPIERAIMLAPTLDICRALLRGERVPLSRLNQRAVRRYGIRRAA